MKTENTLRTVRNSLLCFFTALGAGFLVACGGGGGVSSNEGTFHASDWVVGLDYTYLDNGETGKTGEKGVFPLRGGQSVAFSIGNVTLGTLVSVPEAIDDFITPTRIGDEERAINVEQLLIALDSDDGGTANTITLNAQSATDAMAVMAVIEEGEITTAMNFDVGTPIILSVRSTDTVTVAVDRIIPTEITARNNLENTNNCAFSGAFEGRWTNSDGLTGDTALVLLAFREGRLNAVTNHLGTVRDSLNRIISDENDDRPDDGSLYFNLWKQGGGPETNVMDFGGDAGTLTIGLSGFPVVQTLTTEEDVLITLTVESYERMTYTSAQETGEYRRAANGDIRDADYRLVGFYSDQDNDETPAEAEIGIFAFSANKGGGRVRPYVAWLSSPNEGSDSSSVYSNIGDGGLSDYLDYTGTPQDLVDGDDLGGMKFTEEGDEEVSFTVPASDFTGQSAGFGTYRYSNGDTDGDAEAFVGGWCAL